MNPSKIEENVKQTVFELIKDIEDNIFIDPSEKGDIALVEFFFKRMDPKAVTEHIIKHMLPHKQKIQKRNTDFFIEKKREIFAGIPEDRIDYFVEKIRRSEKEGGYAEGDKKIVWMYFDTLITLVELYKKKK